MSNLSEQDARSRRHRVVNRTPSKLFHRSSDFITAPGRTDPMAFRRRRPPARLTEHHHG